jgi:hypothetical protein
MASTERADTRGSADQEALRLPVEQVFATSRADVASGPHPGPIAEQRAGSKSGALRAAIFGQRRAIF